LLRTLQVLRRKRRQRKEQQKQAWRPPRREQSFGFWKIHHLSFSLSIAIVNSRFLGFVLSGAGYTIYADGFNEQQYIRDQNILSALETFSISTTAAKAPYDGFVYINGAVNGDNQTAYLKIGSTNTVRVYKDSSTSASYFVKKGENVSVSASWAATSAKARWYKLRDYTGR